MGRTAGTDNAKHRFHTNFLDDEVSQVLDMKGCDLEREYQEESSEHCFTRFQRPHRRLNTRIRCPLLYNR